MYIYIYIYVCMYVCMFESVLFLLTKTKLKVTNTKSKTF